MYGMQLNTVFLEELPWPLGSSVCAIHRLFKKAVDRIDICVVLSQKQDTMKSINVTFKYTAAGRNLVYCTQTTILYIITLITTNMLIYT